MSHRHLEANTSKNRRHRHLRRERVVPEAPSLRCPWDPFLTLTLRLSPSPTTPHPGPSTSLQPLSPTRPRPSPLPCTIAIASCSHCSPPPQNDPAFTEATILWCKGKSESGTHLPQTCQQSLFKSSMKSQPGALPLPAAPPPSPWSLAAIWASLLCSPKPHNPPTLGLPSLL